MLRYAVPLVLVIAFVTGLSGRGDAQRTDNATYAVYEPFPADLVAPAPAGSAAELQTEVQGRVVASFASLDAMWQGVFAKLGERWVTPQLRFTDNLQRPCTGATPVSFAGMYCPPESTIYMNLNGLYADAVTQDGALYVLAHEFGHHVQSLRGSLRTKARRGIELNAECLAGVWGKATGRPAQVDEAYPPGHEDSHGSSGDQKLWFERGYAQARPGDCDEVLG